MSKRSVRAVAALCGLALASAGAQAQFITLTTAGTPFNSPVGIDYHEPTNSVIVSSNYPSGFPTNLQLIAPDGTPSPFSNLSGLTDELKIATVRSGNVGGFITGQVFTGNGVPGQIVRVSPDGSSFDNPFVTLPGASGLLRGGMHVDRTGAWGGDLVACTTSGEVYRVTSAGTSTFIANVGTHLEGIHTVPNDPGRYGPLAGRIIAGAENQGLLYSFGQDGSVATYALGVNIEDIDMINANEQFVGVNFGTSRLMQAPASDFAAYVGDFLLTQEFPGSGTSGLYRLHWDGSTLAADPFVLSAFSDIPGQWEHVTFSPVDVPAPGAASLLALAGVGAMRRRRR